MKFLLKIFFFKIKVKKSGAEGTQLEETKKINLSLSCLGSLFLNINSCIINYF